MTWTEPQRKRLARFNAERCVDVHCHCLPGLDDGPASMAETVAMCRALTGDGITTAIATPHQLGAYEGRNSPEVVERAAAAMRAKLAEENIPLEVLTGADVRVHPRLPALIEEKQVSTLAGGGRYLLMELPHEVMINLLPLIGSLGDLGITPILSHPERHAVLSRHPGPLLGWIERGALLQVTAGSLLGQFGAGAKRAAWDWLGSGLVSLVATDAHGAAVRAPCLTEAIESISRHLGHAAARRVCIENPSRVVRGEEIVVAVQRRLRGVTH